MPWRTIEGESPTKGSPEMPILIEGVFAKHRFLDLIQHFTVFGDPGSGIIKVIAGYHQFHAVHKALQSTITATRQNGDRKVGVIWHTQGSGKSFLMAFGYAKLRLMRGNLSVVPNWKTPPSSSLPIATTLMINSLTPSRCAAT